MTATAGRILRALALCAALVALLLCTTAPTAAAVTVRLDVEENKQLAAINRFRVQNGLPRLRIDPTLSRAARWMANDLARHDYFEHRDRHGRSTTKRLHRTFRYPNAWTGENLAAGYPDASNAFRQWRNSAPHRDNWLNPHFRVIGIARAYDPTSTYGWYWVTEFGSVQSGRNFTIRRAVLR